MKSTPSLRTWGFRSLSESCTKNRVPFKKVFASQLPGIRLRRIGSLISESVLTAAIRALPGDAVTAHSPQVLFHTGHANGKSAPAPPAERKCLPAAVAQTRCRLTATLPVGCFFHFRFHFISCRFSIPPNFVKKKLQYPVTRGLINSQDTSCQSIPTRTIS